jgi:catechol 2,3-dioxygenase-like lactoylglutathione lyase family enzyme
MLTSAPVAAVIATTTLERAKEFYEKQLGLTRSEERVPGAGAVLYDCGGGTKLLVYERATADDSEATCASFRVDDVHATAERLRGNGVVFEDYDLGEIKTENGIATMGEFKAACSRTRTGTSSPSRTDRARNALPPRHPGRIRSQRPATRGPRADRVLTLPRGERPRRHEPVPPDCERQGERAVRDRVARPRVA